LTNHHLLVSQLPDLGAYVNVDGELKDIEFPEFTDLEWMIISLLDWWAKVGGSPMLVHK
jgi:hypothetical protein